MRKEILLGSRTFMCELQGRTDVVNGESRVGTLFINPTWNLCVWMISDKRHKNNVICFKRL